jgi:CRISPR type III-B/RAMP module RAMP protein Cmr1
MSIVVRPLEIQTLTPLWSGSETGTCDAGLLETCILGSLRWCMEAIARGYGISVPDIRAEGDDQTKGSCVDELFGSTELKRAFRLEISENSIATVGIPYHVQLPARGPTDRRKGWYFRGEAALLGKNSQPTTQTRSITLRLIPTRDYDEDAENNLAVIQGLFAFISRWGALGARTQHGFGVIEYHSSEGIGALKHWLESHRHGSSGTAGASPGLPSIGKFFPPLVLSQPKLVDPVSIQAFQASLALRRTIRDNFHGLGEDDLRHQVMGWVKGDDRQGSRIFVSLPFPDGKVQRIRIWGWHDDPDLVARRIYGCVPGSPKYSAPSEGYNTMKYVERLLNEAAI